VLLLTFVGLARGTFWAAVLETPSPLDEIQHFDYVRALAHGEGVPVVGQTMVDDEVLQLAKASPTFYLRSAPYPPDKDHQAWRDATVAAQYEGIQGPVYYAVLTPFYWAGQPWGVTGSLYLVRFGSVLLGALAIPVAWLLSRRLVPDRPWMWLLAPVLLTSLNAIQGGAATVGNDILVATGAGVAAVLLLRGLDRRSVGSAVLAGGASGLVLLAKATAFALVPVLLLLAGVQLFRWLREDRALAARWSAAYVVAFGAPMALWTAWNLATYGAPSASAEAEAITGPVQVSYARSFETVRRHWSAVREGFWAGQVNDVRPGYGYWWELVALAVITLAIVVAVRRRDQAGWVAAWGGAAYPLTVTAVAGFFLVAFERSGLLLGRYAWVALLPIVLAVGLSLGIIGGRRFALVLCLVVATGALWLEVDMVKEYVSQTYEQPLAAPGLAPAVEQSWNDGYAAAQAIEIDVPCRSSVLDLGLQAPPRRITVVRAGGTTDGELVETKNAEFSRYRLREPVSGRVEIPVETGVAVSGTELEPAGSLVGGDGDPMVRVHCPVDDAGRVRFNQLYDMGHPPLTRRFIHAWPALWVEVSGVAMVIVLVLSMRGLLLSRRR
jgi:hypothetical protein